MGNFYLLACSVKTKLECDLFSERHTVLLYKNPNRASSIGGKSTSFFFKNGAKRIEFQHLSWPLLKLTWENTGVLAEKNNRIHCMCHKKNKKKQVLCSWKRTTHVIQCQLIQLPSANIAPSTSRFLICEAYLFIYLSDLFFFLKKKSGTTKKMGKQKTIE